MTSPSESFEAETVFEPLLEAFAMGGVYGFTALGGRSIVSDPPTSMSTDPSRCLHMLTTRLAPSPTGALHLGNARTFLINWALARRLSWRILLRIEDLDGPRVKPESIEECIDTLRWLGIDWDEDPVIQSQDLTPYREAMQALARAGRVFPSAHTRQEVEDAAASLALSAPQEGAHDSPFPAALRPSEFPSQFLDDGRNWRFATPEGPVALHDAFAGDRQLVPAQTAGDFVVWTKRGQPAYQLAVVVDDARQGVTNVVRGDDLLDSAARQRLLFEALGHATVPQYWHLPLVLGPDGKRLAKRHGDTRISTYRALGVPAARIRALIARWNDPINAGQLPQMVSAAQFAAGLDLARMPRTPVVCTSEDDAWLRETAR